MQRQMLIGPIQGTAKRGIALAKKAGVYEGRKRSLTAEQSEGIQKASDFTPMKGTI